MRARGGTSALGWRLRSSTVSELPLRSQDAVDGRLRGQVESLIGQTWHYLIGREIPEGGRVHDLEHGSSLLARELVGRRL